MPKMKSSGTRWLGNIPLDWSLSKIGDLYALRNTIVNDNDYQALSVTKKGIYLQLDSVAKTNAHDARKLVKKGDFVINSRSDRRNSCGVSDIDGSVSLINLVLRPKVEMDSVFFELLFKTEAFADEFYANGYGIVDDLWSTKWQQMKKILVPVPSLDTQKIIASFLKNKCVELDSILSDIQSQINILEQYKKSIISEVVTKGLDNSVSTKTCGIENLEEIPEHWSYSRLGYEAYIRARLGWKGLKAEEYVDEGFPFLSAYNIQNNQLVWNPLNFITKQRFDESPEIKLNIGDILIVKDGAGIGKVCKIDKIPYDGATTNSSLGVITPGERLDYRYCYFYLQSSLFNNTIIKLLNGMGVPHLTQEILRNIKIIIPPLTEQIEIAEYLEKKCTEINCIIENMKKQIETLIEYKKSLIYEYVTGKKEVDKDV